ncbi:MAG: alkaline phosphatase family protein [Burkholderiales bacterium]|nr:MAG: alkaline phosphatase family protein [Burkholderiales bacterium]
MNKEGWREIAALPGAGVVAEPDYRGGGLVNLMASVVAACGGPDTGYPPLQGLAVEALAGTRHLVLMVIDGLGLNFLLRQGEMVTLRRHLRGGMTSVFPSTTATAVTTFHTGVAPLQHGLTGWFVDLEEAGGVTAVLPFRRREGGAALSALGIGPEAVFTEPPVFGRLDREAWVVTPLSILDSEYNRWHCRGAQRRAYGTLEQFFAETAAAVAASAHPKLVYAYLPDLDTVAHRAGVGSAPCRELAHRIDQAFAGFLERLAGTDTTVVLTADHGFVDVPPEGRIDLADHPALAAMLRRPLCGEPRAAYCYVKPGREEDFEAYVATRLAGRADAYPSAELVARGWFGDGPRHPRLMERIGDYTLVMRENYAIKDWLPGEKRYSNIGMHGGVSADEMWVPLVVATV